MFPRVHPRASHHRVLALLPVVVFLVHVLSYNLVGALASSRAIDYGPLLMTELDGRLPLVAVMVLPYNLAWTYPLLVLVYLIRVRGWDGELFKRVSARAFVLMVLCYTFWVAFPASVSLRADAATVSAHGVLGGILSLTYAWTTEWNCLPSFHVAGPWLCYRLGGHFAGRLPWLFLLFFALIAWSTVAIRIHYLVDIFGGMLFAEAALLVPPKTGRSTP